ncbi:hypothetical protein RRG46_00825 [Mycoplasmopsis cynos]|uniref:Lipoprotein n=1 Tax=Mycoplasmopsis cynos TaxID=171284 RepID=A0ABD8AJ89_9BACT|nr:hypothetical protein [Mycoplasmopsis cynos]WAM08499.1 hypothetical protein ONA03_02990 [Mycoplasmopsis cynos]WQQ20085.1 hypothetical protein RRG46_00825 [Mycoplasmopsis cynos]
MSKYKKIFSGLGLLSISTLISAGVVACAKTKVEKEETPAPGTSDSKDLATIKNEASVEVEKLQGHEKYAELKAIIDKENATIDELNSAKTSAIEELNKYKEKVQTAIEEITDNTKKEELKKEIETANSYNDLKTIKDKIESKPSPEDKPKNDGKDKPNKKPGETDNPNQGKNEDSTGKENNGKTEPEKGKENEGRNPAPGTPQTPPKMTVDEKVKLLNEFIVNIEYPNKNAPAKAKLKAKVTSIMNEENVKDDDKLKKLDELKTDLDQIKTKLVSVIKEIDDLPYPKGIKLSGNEKTAEDKFKEKLNDKTTVDEITKVLPEGWKDKITKYQKVFDKIGNFINTSNLRKRFVQTDDAKTGDKTESLLIYHVYETVRVWYPKNLKKLNNKDIEKKYADKFKETIKEKNDKDVDWLLSKITEIIDEFSKAKNEINKKDTESTKKQN